MMEMLCHKIQLGNILVQVLFELKYFEKKRLAFLKLHLADYNHKQYAHKAVITLCTKEFPLPSFCLCRNTILSTNSKVIILLN